MNCYTNSKVRNCVGASMTGDCELVETYNEKQGGEQIKLTLQYYVVHMRHFTLIYHEGNSGFILSILRRFLNAL